MQFSNFSRKHKISTLGITDLDTLDSTVYVELGDVAGNSGIGQLCWIF